MTENYQARTIKSIPYQENLLALSAGGRDRMLTMSTLPERLRWILEHRKISAAKLSRDSGLSNAHVGMLIREGIKDPGIDTIERIADTAKVSRGWLAHGTGDPIETDGIDEPSHSESIDDRPTQKEAPSTFGGFGSYSRTEAAARKLAPEVPEWAWQATRTAHPLWIGKEDPSPSVIADVARVIMRHRSG